MSTTNAFLRVLLAIWTVGYVAVSCVPLVFSSSGLIQVAGAAVGLVLLVPWLVGVLVLSILIALTNPRRL